MELSWRVLALVVLVAGASGCAASRDALRLPNAPLVTTAGARVELQSIVSQSPWTVVVFFSRNCKCFTAHQGRFRELDDAYSGRGVRILLVDSEVGSTPDGDAVEAARRGLPYTLLLDPRARLADALGAEYATYTVIVDRDGAIRYRGGFDADRTHLRAGSTPYARDALDDLLAGKEPRVARAKTLGCALEKW